MQTRSQTRKISKKDQSLFYNYPIIDEQSKLGSFICPGYPWLGLTAALLIRLILAVLSDIHQMWNIVGCFFIQRNVKQF